MFYSRPMDEGNADSTRKTLVDTDFTLKVGVLCVGRFELDGDFPSGEIIETAVYSTKSATVNFILEKVPLEIDLLLRCDAHVELMIGTEATDWFGRF
jgi:hypothetical protein